MKKVLMALLVCIMLVACGKKGEGEKPVDPPKKTVKKPVRIEAVELKEPYRKAHDEIMTLFGGINAYLTDHNAAPADLSALFPRYLPVGFETKDPWGTPYLLRVEKDPAGYPIIHLATAGSDRVFSGWDQKGVYTLTGGEDMIFCDSLFVYGPQSAFPVN